MVHLGLSVASVHLAQFEQFLAFVEALNDDFSQVTYDKFFSLNKRRKVRIGIDWYLRDLPGPEGALATE